jgi:hypothetical protein
MEAADEQAQQMAEDWIQRLQAHSTSPGGH